MDNNNNAPDPTTSPPPEAASVKKPVWNIPSNGSIEVKPAVIDENSWPALSESAKSPLKASDGSTPTSVAASSSSSPSKPQFASQNPNSPTNSKKPTRRNIIPSSNGPIPTLPPQSTPNSDTDKTATDSWDGHTAVRQGNRENSIRGGRGYNGNNRRGGNGGRGGVHHGGGRGRNGGGFEGQFRNLGNRELNGPPPPPPPHGFAVPPPYIRPPPPPPLPGAVPALIAPPAVRPPFGAPMVYPEMPPSPVYYVPAAAASPFVPHPHPVGPAPLFFSQIDPQRGALLKQIEYYFSPDNLCKDTWLRRQMDEQGWVPISLIAGFNKVKNITTNVSFILETLLHFSNVVEVQGDRIRKRGDWVTWLLPADSQSATTPVTPSQSPHNTDNLAAQLETVSLTGSSSQSDVSRSESGNNLNSSVEETDHTDRN